MQPEHLLVLQVEGRAVDAHIAEVSSQLSCSTLPCCPSNMCSTASVPPAPRRDVGGLVICGQGPPPPNPAVVERFQQVISQLFQQVLLLGQCTSSDYCMQGPHTAKTDMQLALHTHLLGEHKCLKC